MKHLLEHIDWSRGGDSTNHQDAQATSSRAPCARNGRITYIG